MPAIRLIVNQGKPGEEEIWYRLTEYRIDKDGYLEFFRLHWGEERSSDLWLYRRNISFTDFAVGLLGAATSLRSAKGLLESFNKKAGKLAWKGKSGAVGLAFGSAAMLAEFLQAQPFRDEGYYDGDHNLVLKRKIHTNDRDDYDPRSSPSN